MLSQLRYQDDVPLTNSRELVNSSNRSVCESAPKRQAISNIIHISEIPPIFRTPKITISSHLERTVPSSKS